MPQSDFEFMARAIQLAEKGLFTSDPNPRVGCVLVKDNTIIGEGWHQWAGQAHAEVNAIADAQRRGLNVNGATAYVTLEPCCHQGKTGPCTQALIHAGVHGIVYGMEDPFPQVAGQGLAQLQAAGMQIVGPMMEDGVRQLNPGFIKRMQKGLPFVRVKMAMSLDGRTAMASGESKWITSAPARRDVQHWRARSSAIVTGIGTVLHDNPELWVRAGDLDLNENAVQQPLRVILDSHNRLPNAARILHGPGSVLQILAGQVENIEKTDMAYQRITFTAKNGTIDLLQTLQYLAGLQCNEILVEAGATLAGQFIQQGLVDQVLIYVAPKLLGSSARPLFDLPLDTMAAQLGLCIQDVRAVGQDWRISAILDPEA